MVYLVKGCSDGLRVLEVSDTHSGAFVRMPGDVTYVYRRFPKVSQALVVLEHDTHSLCLKSYYIPRDAFNITMLQKVLAISTEKTIVVIQPSTYGVDLQFWLEADTTLSDLNHRPSRLSQTSAVLATFHGRAR